MKYCMRCRGQLGFSIPAGDDRRRLVCPDCGNIHYENPKMVVGTIPVQRGKILLCRRAIEPQQGLWTLPAGYLENGESLLEGAKRESKEEAKAVLDDLHPYALCNLTFVNQLYFFYRAQLMNNDFGPGSETLETCLFPPDMVPWDNLAFTVIRDVLLEFCADLKRIHFPFRVMDIVRRKV